MKAFDCKMCGECCYGEGGIFMEEDEQKRIAKYLGLDLEDFLEQYTVEAPRPNLCRRGAGQFLYLLPERKGLYHSYRKAGPL